jgi:hypothetical protein
MDVLCQAKSGMGKTAVFVLSVLQQLEPVDGEVGAIIICHTRELAYQVRTRICFFFFAGRALASARQRQPSLPPSPLVSARLEWVEKNTPPCFPSHTLSPPPPQHPHNRLTLSQIKRK